MMTRRSLLVAAILPLAAALPALGLFELRSYRTVPGRRDTLIEMFETHFLDAYQAAGARIIASFRVEGDSDRWIWIRAFIDNEARATALSGFYGSALWKRHAAECNATIEDVSDSLLLRSIGRLVPPDAPTIGIPPSPAIFELSRHFLPTIPSDTEAGRIARADAARGEPIAALVSAGVPNSYSRMPLREDPAVVTLIRPGTATGHPGDTAERLRLRPTARSALR